MKTYELSINQETANYLQRLQLDVDTRLSVIDRLFTNHKDDTDTSVFESAPWKKYNQELQEATAQYKEAKDALSKYLMPVVQKKEGSEDVSFDWLIEDFSSCKVKITVR